MKRVKMMAMALLGMLIIFSMVSAQEHVIISEVVLDPSDGEFIEIYNPTSGDVDLSDYHLADFNTYYKIAENDLSSIGFSDFSVKFPSGTVIGSGQVMVVAVTGSGFLTTYGEAPDFEIIPSDATIADMKTDSSRVTSSALSNYDEMIILYYWDGSSATVKDVDYLIWGDNTSYFVDKSYETGYADDTSVSEQLNYTFIPSATDGYRILRMTVDEPGETVSGGNGITGHDETSEHFNENFVLSALEANPGVFGFRDAVSGDGRASVEPSSVEAFLPNDFQIKIWGEITNPVSVVTLEIPANWTFSEDSITVTGEGFNGADFTLDGNVLTVNNAAVTLTDSGFIYINGMVAEGEARTDTFKVATAVNGETPMEIAIQPMVTVQPGVTPIGLIQENESQYLGKEVKIRGVITIGSGALVDTRTNCYVSDDTGAGIEIYNYVYDEQFSRGDSVEIVGTIDNYNGVTEITDYTVTKLAENCELPRPLPFDTGDLLNDTEFDYEGYWITLTAPITDKYYAGGGYNVLLDDGTGEITVRIWDVSGVDLSFYNIGDTITVKGVETVYNNAPQLTAAYEEDVNIFSLKSSLADGSGVLSLDGDAFAKDSLISSLTITLAGSVADTITDMAITVPYEWSAPESIIIAGDGAINHTAVWEEEDGLNNLVISGLEVLRRDSLKITFNNIRTPNRNLLSTWHVSTAGNGGTLKDIGAAPQVVIGNADSSIVPIYDVQRALHLFDNVTLEGIITIGVKTLRADRTSAYMQDGSGFGINISSFTVYDELIRGTVVKIKGTVSDYSKTTQIQPSTGGITVLGTDTLPEPRLVKTDDLNGPKYDGTFVKVWGVVTEMYSTSPGDYNITITDGSGPLTVRVWGSTGISTDKIEVGDDALWVSGVGGVYVTADADLYQILPAYEEDMQIDMNYEGSLEGVSLDIPPYTVVPDMGETVMIKFDAGTPSNHAVLRIFDLNGRVVKTLFDENVVINPNSVVWDGKDQYGRYVNLGTYICHLEVVVNRNGKRKIKTAPIVIGTRLK